MTNMNIICISSVCCDLRFYDISNVDECNLRLYIRNFPSPLSAFHYYYCEDSINNEASSSSDDNHDVGENISRLIFGDFAGSVRMIDFTKNFKTNFRRGSMIRQISYSELMKVRIDLKWEELRELGAMSYLRNGRLEEIGWWTYWRLSVFLFKISKN